ncbi:MAG: hypothetical protein ACOCSI_03615, partial [Desulfohalobiaceae bacterium]
ANSLDGGMETRLSWFGLAAISPAANYRLLTSLGSKILQDAAGKISIIAELMYPLNLFCKLKLKLSICKK